MRRAATGIKHDAAWIGQAVGNSEIFESDRCEAVFPYATTPRRKKTP
jgi:hypothetical protein